MKLIKRPCKVSLFSNGQNIIYCESVNLQVVRTIGVAFDNSIFSSTLSWFIPGSYIYDPYIRRTPIQQFNVRILITLRLISRLEI